MLNHYFIQESRANYILPVYLGRVLTILYACLSLALRVYLVLAKSKPEKQFSSQIDLYCRI